MSSSDVQSTLTEFVDELEEKIDTHRLEDILSGDGSLTSADLGSKPESWTRKHLIRPLLDDVSLEWEPEIHGGGEGYPDFGLENLDVLVIGEDKPVNAIEEAEDDVKEYLNNRAASQGAEYGIATDGIEWAVYRIELGGDYLAYSPVATHNFRDTLLQIARDKNYISQASVSEVDIEESSAEFFETFDRDAFNTLLTREAPKRIRKQKQAGIEEFYDLYVELLFGEGSSSHDYETTLLDDVKAPPGANDTDRRRFTIRLVNRLLFVKFLEDRGVLPDRFLTERVEKYEQATNEVDDIGGGLYKSQLEPLFFGLFNAEDRISKHQGGWFDDIPYLNGSLFAPEEYERDYDVDDRMLITVVRDLVEGSELSDDGDDALDPSVLGNVFEMTINHISSGEAQKEEGAYYTPSDVIRVITDDTVDPKAYEILVDVYGDRLSESTDLSEDDARSLVQSYELGEILRKIEQREGYFSDPDAIEDAYDQLGELKVIDPSCGSGHFLTGVLDELHRIRMSLLRGLHGEDLEDKDVYQAKKDLVLTSIYGVDVNPIAIEIAKLRVWLKMVEEGWEEQYGQLPNIDINIVPGNSLIGLPAISEGQAVLQSFDIDLSKLADLREAYRSGDITRRELDRRIDDLRPELRQYYLDQINHYFEDRVTAGEEWESITAGLDELFPSIQKITARQNNEEQLSDDQQARLEDAGFSVEPRFEKSAKIEGEDIDTVNDYSSLLDSGFIFELERQPTTHDVEELTALKHREERLALAYEPFHYPVEFPEVATSNGSGYDVEFDIVVGNPPYGNVMEDIEKRFVEGYKTGSVNDIVAQFVERQLQILDDGGYLGNILALMFAYQTNAAPVREVLRDNLAETTIACFSRRPSQVFAGSQARSGIVTGRRQDGGDDQSIQTSRFIRFTDDNRQEVFRNITYESTAGLTLGETIGSGEDYALPKIGESEIRSILEKLKDESDTVFRDKMSRSDETDHVVWRSYHPAYFCNPFLEDLYPAGEQSRDFKPMYFDNDLYRRSAFLLMQSSLFYMWWMVFENERDLNWKSIDAFPFPDEETLEENREGIEELSEVLWEEMEDRFLGNIRETFDTIGAVKPITDKADDLFGPMYGLDEEEVEFVKGYDEEYRLSDVDQSQLVEYE